MAIQQMTVDARVAIRLHSQDGNMQKLCHDLRSGPADVFGGHSHCSPSFCKFSHTGSTQESEKDRVTTESRDATCDTRNPEDQETLTDHVSNILLCITYGEDVSDLCICYYYH